ncbi:hypothetical protein TIFTF001_044189 [Ficus carica]|uniref:Uncharacterized protein n=1 Tax=Ficus carica TaxID=3494 RepID=A0AA87Z956_FICCA|nr:hypothetical protein TIFTF001_044189 [Ficus carica]
MLKRKEQSPNLHCRPPSRPKSTPQIPTPSTSRNQDLPCPVISILFPTLGKRSLVSYNDRFLPARSTTAKHYTTGEISPCTMKCSPPLTRSTKWTKSLPPSPERLASPMLKIFPL